MAVSFIIFILFIMIYVLISDIITILFRLTGLTEEFSKFQVISLLTNSGFTTKESEAIVSSKIRRRLAQGTMLFGYVFSVTIVATMVNFFMSLDKEEIGNLLVAIPVMVVILLIFYFFRKSTYFKNKFDHLIERIGSRFMYGSDTNPIVIIESYDEMVMAQVYLNKVPQSLKDVPLSESDIMSKYKIMVLMIKNKSGEAKQATASTVLKENDIIVLLGKYKHIKDIME